MTQATETAESIHVVRPESVGLCSERLARIEAHMTRRYIAPRKIAGALTLVARKGEVAYLSAVGEMDIERSKPMTADTIFRIYSMTKPITSVALMMLYEHGHFQLDDPVYKFIPEWRNLGVYQLGNHPNWVTSPCERPMTIRDLLTHTSGLTYDFMERTNVDRAYRRLDIGRDRQKDLRSMVETLAGVPLEFSPGTAWNYSVASDVVGYLIELISGMPLDAYFQEQIFEPLGMVDTGFVVPADKINRFAANYTRGRDKRPRLEDDPATSVYTQPTSFFSGGGGLVSTAADYLQFCRMLLGHGELNGHRLLGRKTLELMTSNHLPNGQDLTDLATGAFSETTYEGVGFGLGFSVQLDPAKSQIVGSPGEFAWGGAASTAFWVDPSEELITIFMTQLMPSRVFNFRGQLKSIIYPAIID
ncbi:MAG TPA: class A beta-lactamase-related serine hydrolase [Myxococcales bacterium]|nr:class A beta-lactamase-related serine hydrolase [Myxococcales bacterium]HIK86076.1 class A beta-lactamase-related serine hydrolase [Myxococcales bacterium]